MMSASNSQPKIKGFVYQTINNDASPVHLDKEANTPFTSVQPAGDNNGSQFPASKGPKSSEEPSTLKEQPNTSDSRAKGATRASPSSKESGYSTTLQHYDCLYHRPILQMDDAGDQYALFRRADNGQLSTFRACTCLDRVDINFGATEATHKSDINRDNLSGYQVGL